MGTSHVTFEMQSRHPRGVKETRAYLSQGKVQAEAENLSVISAQMVFKALRVCKNTQEENLEKARAKARVQTFRELAISENADLHA